MNLKGECVEGKSVEVEVSWEGGGKVGSIKDPWVHS